MAVSLRILFEPCPLDQLTVKVIGLSKYAVAALTTKLGNVFSPEPLSLPVNLVDHVV